MDPDAGEIEGGKREKSAIREDTLNPTYSPRENRYGLYLTLGLVAALSVLGALLIAVLPGSSEGSMSSGSSGQPGSGNGSADTSSGDNGASGRSPDDLSFLCGGPPVSETADLSTEERETLERQAEDFVLTMWGDPGSDAEEYRSSLDERVISDCFWEGYGAQLVADREEIAFRGGAKEASAGDEGPAFATEFLVFEPLSIGPIEDSESGARYVGATGDALWISEKADGSGRVAYQQEMALVKPENGTEWRVSETGPVYDNIGSEHQQYLPAGLEG